MDEAAQAAQQAHTYNTADLYNHHDIYKAKQEEAKDRENHVQRSILGRSLRRLQHHQGTAVRLLQERTFSLRRPRPFSLLTAATHVQLPIGRTMKHTV
ncbi:hypothetical protein HO173_010337 [Letharia columbiana]|uniref:Uncharacterized protein n=1 Tax=Letharia columbiana TaxID=112416 RepID=A0A8H6L0W3_9LECA|nr:uncharacterized protein HO173_010337 [Letharia columbiana]KAF6231377.1 hypothetical protein HO173_010337 [Letharia columbiana]